VLRRQPAAAALVEPARHALRDARRTEDARLPLRPEGHAVRLLEKARVGDDRPQLVRAPAVLPAHDAPPSGERSRPVTQTDVRAEPARPEFGADKRRLMMRRPPENAPGRQRRRTYGQSPHVLSSAPTSVASCRCLLELRHGDVLDLAERQLQEALAELPEEL